MDMAIICSGNNSNNTGNKTGFPNGLIKIGNEYIIERLIRSARENDIKNIFCIISEREPELKEFLAKNNFGIPVHLTVKECGSGLHSLFTLAPHLMEERFCVTAGDRVFDENEFSDFIDFSLLQEDSAGIIAVTRRIDEEDPYCLAMDENDFITKFSDAKEGYNWSTGGLFTFTPEIFNEMQPAIENNVTSFKGFLKMLVTHSYPMKGFAFSKTIKVNSAAGIKKAELFLRGQNKAAGHSSRFSQLLNIYSHNSKYKTDISNLI